MTKRSSRPSRAARKTIAPAVSAERAAVGVRYIESSALVAALLEHDAQR